MKRFIAAVSLIIAVGLIYMYKTITGYSVGYPYDIFENSFQLIALLFPILILPFGLIQFTMSSKSGFHRPVQTRQTLKEYILSETLMTAFRTGLGFFIAVSILGLLSFAILPEYPGVIGSIKSPVPPEGLHRMSQLMKYGWPVYLISYAAWVGLQSALYGALSILMSVWISNRIVVLAAPFLVWTGLSLPLALLWLESFAADYSMFPFGLQQVPFWQSLPVVGIVAGAILLLWFMASCEEFQTPGLD